MWIYEGLCQTFFSQEASVEHSPGSEDKITPLFADNVSQAPPSAPPIRTNSNLFPSLQDKDKEYIRTTVMPRLVSYAKNEWGSYFNLGLLVTDGIGLTLWKH
jgi:hypothetical protein